MNITEFRNIVEECKQELAAVGYKEVLTNTYRLSFNTRAKKRLGRCRGMGGHTFEIILNKLHADVNPKGARQTIMHELIHSINGCMNHEAPWKRVVAIVNRKYGYEIARQTKFNEEYQKAAYGDKKVEYKYILQCQKCGGRIRRQKKTKVVTHPEQFRCMCGGHLKLM